MNRVVGSHWNQEDKLWITMNISNRLVDLHAKVTLRAPGVNNTPDES